MNIRKNINTIIAAALAVMAVAACKKDDEETETLPSLSGQLRFEAAPYIKKNETLTMTPSGLTHPEGKGIGFYWTITDVTTKNDTTKTENGTGNGAYTAKFPDETGTYTVSCTAFASGYYNTSVNKYVTVVDKDESLIDISKGYTGEYGTCTDTRDGRSYKTVTIGNTEWFAENLKYSGLSENGTENTGVRNNTGSSENGRADKIGIAYENAEAMSDIFGRYYSWEEATDKTNPVCPKGWRIPDAEDWLALANGLDRMNGEASDTDGTDGHASGVTSDVDRFTDINTDYEGITGAMMVEAKFNSEKNEMWDYWPDVNITNLSGLSMIPCGFANLSKTTEGNPVGSFETVNLYAAFWTAESEEDKAMFRYIYWDTPVLQLGQASKTDFAATVRCVRDITTTE